MTINPATHGYSRMDIPAPAKPRLRIVADECNNVNRLCTISSTAFPKRTRFVGRVWQIKTPMRNTREGFELWYVCEHIHTGERVIAPSGRMNNVY